MNKFQLFGFQYSDILTNKIRQVALDEMHKAKADQTNPEELGPDGEYWNAQHVWLTMMVFVNPAVASLPEHAHLMAEPGCYGGKSEKSEIIHVECQGENESKLPDSFKSLQPTKEKKQVWFDKIRERVNAGKRQ